MKNDKDITIYKMMEKMSNRISEKEIFVFPETGKRYTYKEFDKKVNEACKGLIVQGITKGSHVGLWMDNIEEWFILFFALNKIGAITIPINPKYNIDEMNYILNKFDIDMLVMSIGYKKVHKDIINNIIPNMIVPNNNYPRLNKIITIGFENNNAITYSNMIESGKNIKNNIINELYNNTFSEDDSIILPTSGTTGYSKGVQLNNYQLIRNGFDIGERYGLNGNDKMLIQVPMVHCFGITLSMLAALTHGSCMNVVSSFNAELALKIIEQEKITCINGVPSMYNEILNNNSFYQYDISSLKKGIMAGSNCYPEFMKKASTMMNMKIISVYGLSEASPGCTMSSIYDNDFIRFNTVGNVLPGIECKIIDPETKMEVDIGEEGEFIVRGYNVMKEYYNDYEETKKVIDENGFLHTGDIAKKLSDQTFVIIGRYKDVIIRGGENIYPSEVMRILNKCPGVIDSCVFGVKDSKLGQEIKACIIAENECVTVDNIIKYMRQNCAKYKIPKYFEFVPEFIKNNNGKVLKYKMEQKYSKTY